jgi:plastocyanin
VPEPYLLKNRYLEIIAASVIVIIFFVVFFIVPNNVTFAQSEASSVVNIVSDSSTKTTDAFSPNPINVRSGDTVAWTNNDNQPHTIMSGQNGVPDGKFNSSPNLNPIIAPGQTFSYQFTQLGTYPYFCQLHPNMIGTVIVNGDNETITATPLITISTDKSSYTTGDKIQVTGRVTSNNGIIDEPILIKATDPDGRPVRWDETIAAVNGTFSYTFTAGGLMDSNGTYSVMASYEGNSAQTSFQFAYKPS